MTEPVEIRDVLRSIQIGPNTVPVTEPLLVQTGAAEVYVYLRVVEGWVAITLGAYSEEAGPPEIRITHRLRMPLSLLANIQTAVAMQVDGLAQAKQSAN